VPGAEALPTDIAETPDPTEPATEPGAAGVLRTWLDTPLAGKAILAGIVVNRFGAFMQIYLVLFLTHRGFSTVQAGLALGIYGAGAVVGVLVGGELTDRLGSRRTILFSMSGTAAFILAVLYVPYFPALLIAVGVVAAIGQAYRPASSTLLAELTPKARYTMTFAMYRLAFNVGSMVAPLLGAVLVAVSYNLLFWVEALAAVGYAVIAIVALPAKGGGRKKAAAEMDQGRTSYLDVIRDRRFMLFLVSMMINALIYIQYLSVLPLAMKAAGLATGYYAAMVALNGAVVVGFELFITKFTQRWPLRLIMALGFLLLGGGRALYAIPWGLAIFVIGTLVWTLAEIIAGPTMFAYPPMAAPKHLRGRYIAASSAMFGVGTAVGPIVGLALWSSVGVHVWWILALVEFAGLAAAMAGVRGSALARPKSSTDGGARVRRPVAGQVRDWLRPSGYLVQQLFRDRTAVWVQVAARRDLASLTGRLLSVGLPSLAIYGLVLGADGGWAQSLATAVKLPLLFVSAALICLPTFYACCRLIGATISWAQALILAIVAITVAGVTALAMLPISAFFLLTTGYVFFKLISVGLLVLAATAGVSVIASGVTTVCAAQVELAPLIGGPNGAGPAPAESAGEIGHAEVPARQPVLVGAAAEAAPRRERPTGGNILADVLPTHGRAETAILTTRRVTSMPLPPARQVRVLLVAWGLLFGLVGSQLAWVLRPFFGAPSEPFAFLRPLHGSFLADLVHTIGHLF
jgi:MFS family permease